MSLRTRLTALLAGLSAGMAVIGAAEAAGRVALVMVAEDYVKFQKSSIGASRAKLVADALSAKGFDVVLSENPSNSGARASLRDFAAKAAGADVALAVLAGHAIAASGQSFFLPVNADITAPTDLFSRGIAVSSVALMASKAKAGAVLVLMTSPNFATPIEGIDMRPEFASELTPNVVAAFSSSEKVPVSQVEAVGAGATAALAGAIDAPAPTLGDAVAAVVGTGGVAFGTTSKASLTAKPAPAPAPAPEPTVAAAPPPPPVEDKSAALLSQLDRERQAREEAERQAEDDKARAQAALREAEKAQAELARVQEAARKAQAAADAAQAETERAKAEAERAHADAEQAQAAAKAQQDQATADEQRNAAVVRAARAEADAAKAARVQAEAERAKADKLAEERAQAAEAARAQAESAKAEAAARVSQETQRIVAAAPPAEPEPAATPAPAPAAALGHAPAPAPAPEPATVATATPDEPVVAEPEAPVDEDADAQRQRQRIQQRLHELGFYQGPLDAIMGPMTRQAIMAYQKHRGEAETGYLTPEQFEALIPPPKG